MQSFEYSIIGIIALIVQAIINMKTLVTTSYEQTTASKTYRRFVLCILAYIITDIFWGITAEIGITPILYADTFIYYIAMASTVIIWTNYVVSYLEETGVWRGFLIWFGRFFFYTELLILVVNLFIPIFFWFDETGNYQCSVLRYLMLAAQVLMFLLTSIRTGIHSYHTTNEAIRNRQLAVCTFGIVMVATAFFQLLWPLYPIYSLGLLIGCSTLHIYVVEAEHTELAESFIAAQKKHQQEIENNLSQLRIYADQLSNYKKTVLSDALISLEINLSTGQLEYGVWKDDDGNEVPLADILGFNTPCSYDAYITTWKKLFISTGETGNFKDKTSIDYLLDIYSCGKTGLTFDYAARTISGRNAWLRRNIYMTKNNAGDIIAYTSVKDVTAIVEQSKREQAYIRSLATEYDSINVVKLEEDKTKDTVIQRSRIAGAVNNIIDDATKNEPNFATKLQLFSRFVYPEDRELFIQNSKRENIFQSFAEDKTHVVDFRLMDSKNSCLYYQFRFVPIRDDSDNIGGLIACLRNIDEEIRKEFGIRQELENARISAEAANLAKSSFLFTMSHDIRTPMNAIIGFTDIAEKHIDDKNKVSEALHKVKISSEHLLSLINDVLDMSRVESGHVTINEEPFFIDDIKENLHSILAGSAKSKNITLTSILDSSISHHWVMIDRLLMMRVLTNIVSNSVKYTNPNGKIDITIEELPCQKDGFAHFRYTVQDTGIGMSPEFLAQIFEPFTRAETATKSGIIGTGLGMSITKSLVELMNGTISIESHLNIGTKVIMEFENPISEATGTGNNKKEAVPVNLTGKKILLVEDNELNREIATDILEEHGVIIDVAEDGDVAVEKIKNAPKGRYDLILMDVQMPRMNGYDATRAIRCLPNTYAANIPIIAMTANAFEEDRQNAIAAGMNNQLAKPIDIPKLLAVLSATLQE